VPVYNSQNYLDRFFKSINTLIVQDFELILVDDGSTDDSLKEIQSYSRSQKFECVVIHKENGGQSTARNLGLKQAKGDFVCFIDSDDTISKDYFSIFENFKSGFQAYDMLIGNFKTVSQVNTPSNKKKSNIKYKNICDYKEKMLFMNKFLKKHIKIHNSAICYKRNFLKADHCCNSCK
jgi:glycosyltransferase involved in cell wall biosynthesis